MHGNGESTMRKLLNFNDCSLRTMILALIIGVAGCSPDARQDNALLDPWTGPYGGVPAFDRMELSDLKPALEAAMTAKLTEIEAIVQQPRAPDLRQHAGRTRGRRTGAGSGRNLSGHLAVQPVLTGIPRDQRRDGTAGWPNSTPRCFRTRRCSTASRRSHDSSATGEPGRGTATSARDQLFCALSVAVRC